MDLTLKADAPWEARSGRPAGAAPRPGLLDRRPLTTLTDASGFHGTRTTHKMLGQFDLGSPARLPLSFLGGRESPRRLRYAVGTFTSDQGVLDQPLPLVPADMDALPGRARARIEEMRAP